MNRYKYSAFRVNGEYLAWENDLPWLARLHSLKVGQDVLEIILNAIGDRPQGNTAAPIGTDVFKIWHRWEKRDGHDVLLVRVKMLEDGESVDAKRPMSSKRA